MSERRICLTCDAGDPTSIIKYEDCECPKPPAPRIVAECGVSDAGRAIFGSCSGDMWESPGYFYSGRSHYLCQHHAMSSMKMNPLGARYRALSHDVRPVGGKVGR